MVFWRWLAGTNCIFIWLYARDEGGMRGRYLPLIPQPPPKPNLDRPVWGTYNALRPYRSRGKEAAAAASFPLGEGLGWTNVQPRLMLVWAYLNLYPDHHFTRGRGRTLGQGHCHWYVCRPDLLFGHPWTRYHMSLWLIIVLCLVLRAYLGHLLSICTQIHQVLSLSPGNNESNGIRY